MAKDSDSHSYHAINSARPSINALVCALGMGTASGSAFEQEVLPLLFTRSARGQSGVLLLSKEVKELCGLGKQEGNVAGVSGADGGREEISAMRVVYTGIPVLEWVSTRQKVSCSGVFTCAWPLVVQAKKKPEEEGELVEGTAEGGFWRLRQEGVDMIAPHATAQKLTIEYGSDDHRLLTARVRAPLKFKLVLCSDFSQQVGDDGHALSHGPCIISIVQDSVTGWEVEQNIAAIRCAAKGGGGSALVVHTDDHSASGSGRARMARASSHKGNASSVANNARRR
jgi:hypothetical protein